MRRGQLDSLHQQAESNPESQVCSAAWPVNRCMGPADCKPLLHIMIQTAHDRIHQHCR